MNKDLAFDALVFHRNKFTIAFYCFTSDNLTESLKLLYKNGIHCDDVRVKYIRGKQGFVEGAERCYVHVSPLLS